MPTMPKPRQLAVLECLTGPLTSWQRNVHTDKNSSAGQQQAGNRNPGSSVAPTLAQLGKCHSDALIAHKKSFCGEVLTWGGPDRFYEEVLTASADRFYGEVLTCQWHIDALDAQLTLLEEVAHCDPEAPTQGSAALERCLVALEEQHASAVDSLLERAAAYTHSVCGDRKDSTAADEIVGNRDVPKCFEQCLRVAEFTYAGIAEETRAMVEVLPGDDVKLGGLTFCEGVSHGGRIAGHYSAMWQRQSFWASQLAETWMEWEKATECMHNACDNGANIWSDRFHNPLDAQPTLLQGLANDKARAFEVKLNDMTRVPFGRAQTLWVACSKYRSHKFCMLCVFFHSIIELSIIWLPLQSWLGLASARPGRRLPHISCLIQSASLHD